MSGDPVDWSKLPFWCPRMWHNDPLQKLWKASSGSRYSILVAAWNCSKYGKKLLFLVSFSLSNRQHLCNDKKYQNLDRSKSSKPGGRLSAQKVTSSSSQQSQTSTFDLLQSRIMAALSTFPEVQKESGILPVSCVPWIATETKSRMRTWNIVSTKEEY
jgi:hypothetical protein